MVYSAVLRAHTPEAIDAFCDWIRNRTDQFEELPTSGSVLAAVTCSSAKSS